MPIKIRVDVTEINDRLSDILPIIESYAKIYGGEGSIITSTREGENGELFKRSNVLIVIIAREQNMALISRELERMISPGYNIVEKHGVIKITWDHKREKGNEKCL